MSVENIPETYIKNNQETPDLFVYDFKMTNDVVKSKVNLGMNMFSFLQEGKKQVHFAGTSVAVNKDQSLLLKKGNWLWTELLDTEALPNIQDRMENGYKTRKNELRLWIKLLDILHLFPP